MSVAAVDTAGVTVVKLTTIHDDQNAKRVRLSAGTVKIGGVANTAGNQGQAVERNLRRATKSSAGYTPRIVRSIGSGRTRSAQRFLLGSK
jgi:hypothetical protein